MRAALATACAALCAGCSGTTVTVITVDARPSVHAAATLSVELSNASSMLTQDFDLHGHAFPSTFSVTTPGRSGEITFVARAKDDGGAVVGIGSTTTTIQDGDETTAALLLDPADFPVNTQVAGAQRTVFYVSTGARQIAAAATGTFTIAWTDDCGSLARCDEWGRRFDPTGAPASTAIAAGTAQFNVNRTEIFGTDPAITTGPDGSLLAVWTTQQNIACSAIAPDGSAASPAEVLLSDGAMPDHPAVVAFKDLFAVAWQENLMGANTPVIRLRFVDKTCAPASVALTVSQSASPVPVEPALAVSTDGNEVALVWRAGSSLRGRFIAGSSALGDGEVVLVPLGADTLWGPQISATNGGYALVYGVKTATGPLPQGGFLLHRIKSGGGPLGFETVIATAVPDMTSVAGVARRSDGALAVTWHECGPTGDGVGCGVLAQIVRPTGLPVGAPIVVDTTTQGDQTDPSIAALPDAFAVAWTDGSGVAPDQSMTGIRARVLYPPYDSARFVLGAPCSADAPCSAGLVCAAGSDGASHCHTTCDPAGAPPLCPAGGTCTQGAGGAACIF